MPHDWMSLAPLFAVLGVVACTVGCAGSGGSECAGGGFYLDSDGDGYGDPDQPSPDCRAAPGYADNHKDCDDSDPELTPSTRWYKDSDGDGYGAAYNVTISCAAPPDTVRDDTDCDDTDPLLHPDAPWFEDADEDGYGGSVQVAVGCDAVEGASVVDGDCDDADATIHPDAVEICDDIDQDCDGDVLGDAEIAWFTDSDGDGYGDPASVPVESCEPVEGHASNADDCNDDSRWQSPAGHEVCDDGVDQDCDGSDTCGTSGGVDLAEQGMGIEGTSGEGLGTSVAGAGDLDGDGFDDLILGMPEHGIGGGALIVPGSSSGPDISRVMTLTSESSAAAFGWWVAPGGDLNDDGYDDVVVGAPTWGSSDQGGAHIYLGPLTGDLLDTEADARFYGSASSWTLVGNRAMGSGDLFATTATATTGNQLLALVDDAASGTWTVGQADSLLYGFAAVGTDGYALSFDLADLDGDGITDVVVGSPDHETASTGAVFVFYGLSDSVIGNGKGADADVIITGRGASNFGADVGVAPDLDGDGNPDLVVGAPGRGKRVPAVHIFSGSGLTSTSYYRADATLEGGMLDSGSSDLTGASIAVLGDVNGDRDADLLIGAPAAGKSWLAVGPFLGTMSLADEAYAVITDGGGTGLGAAVGTAGDLDGDGYSDMVLGTPSASAGHVLLGGP